MPKQSISNPVRPRKPRSGSSTLTGVMATLIAATAMMGLTQTAQAQTRIAVTAFENKVKMPWWDASWKIGDGLAEMLSSELVKTGQFTVVERLGLADVAAEQALGQSGLVRRESAAASGQMLGAQVIVRGAITEFQEDASGGNLGVQRGGTQLQGSAQTGHIGLDLRLIDAATGVIIASQNISRPVPGGGIGIGRQTRSVDFGGQAYFQTPIGQATRAAMQDAVQFVLARTPRLTAPRSFSVVKVEGSAVYLNAGANANVKVGDVLQVYSRGEALIDPDTGLRLGAAERAIAQIQITEVQDQFSIAVIQGATGAMKRGDPVRPR